MIKQVWHFSFTVSDIERSVPFYRDLLGMELVKEQVQANAYTRKFVGYADAHIKVAQLKAAEGPIGPSGHILELCEYVSPEGEPVDTGTCNPGVAHLAFVVDDIEAEYERLRAAGVIFVSEPVTITEGVNKGGSACYFKDPDGITLELVRPPKGEVSDGNDPGGA